MSGLLHCGQCYTSWTIVIEGLGFDLLEVYFISISDWPTVTL